MLRVLQIKLLWILVYSVCIWVWMNVNVLSFVWDSCLGMQLLGHRTPWTEGPGRLQFIESPRVGHDRATLHARTVIAYWVLKETTTLFSRMALPFYIPVKNVWVIHFVHILASTWWCHLFLFNHSVSCAVMSHCGFNLHFRNEYSSVLNIFHVPIWQLYVLFQEILVHVFCQFSNWIVLSLNFESF